MKITNIVLSASLILLNTVFHTHAVFADNNVKCAGLPSQAELTAKLKLSVAVSGGSGNDGFDLNMRATVVNRDGEV